MITFLDGKLALALPTQAIVNVVDAVIVSIGGGVCFVKLLEDVGGDGVVAGRRDGLAQVHPASPQFA